MFYKIIIIFIYLTIFLGLYKTTDAYVRRESYHITIISSETDGYQTCINSGASSFEVPMLTNL